MYVPYLWALYRFLSPCLWVSENKGNGVIQTGQQLSNNCSNTRLTVNRASCLTFTLMSIFVVGFFLSPQNYSIIKRFLDLCFHNDTTLFWWRNSLFIPFQKNISNGYFLCSSGNPTASFLARQRFRFDLTSDFAFVSFTVEKKKKTNAVNIISQQREYRRNISKSKRCVLNP